MSSKLTIIGTLIYLLCGISLLFFYIPGHDTLYYFNWSQHLALGYYDGPPVIAYYLRLWTAVFGSSEYALILIGLLSNVIIASLVYQLAKLLFNKEVAGFAFVAWLMTPLTFGIYALQVTCDTSACIFALLALYLFYRFFLTNKSIYIYSAAISASLMILSKLTGVTICLSLVVLLLTKNYRHLLKNKHLYAAICLLLLLTVPIMVWGEMHGLEGLQFQMQHGLSHWSFKHLLNIVNYIIATLSMYNFYLLLFIYFCVKYFKKIMVSAPLQLVFIPAAVVFLFYLIASLSNASFHWNWNDLFYITLPIGIAFAAIQSQGMQRCFTAATIFNMLIMVILVIFVISNILNIKSFNKQLTNTVGKHVALELKKYVQDQDYVFSDDYKLSALLNYYVPRKYMVYSFAGQGNQYQYWSHQANQQIKAQLIKHFIYLSEVNVAPKLTGYQCRHIYTSKAKLGVNLAVGGSNKTVFVFDCQAS